MMRRRKNNLALVRRQDRIQSQRLETLPERTHKTSESHESKDLVKRKLYTRVWEDQSFSIGNSAAVRLLMSFRICSAVWSNISDCDEVFNYWEPLHVFLFGSGFQTWEYSPVYAIRSYFYILLHYVPSVVLTLLMGIEYKIAIFTSIRCVLGAFCLWGEYRLFVAINDKFHTNAAMAFLTFTACSTGLFISSTSFLPSAFAMSLNYYLLAAYINEEWRLAIGCTALSALIGWPFNAIMGLPIVVDMLMIRPRSTKLKFVVHALLYGGAISAAMIVCDSFFFGKFVFAPLNIVLYNVLSGPGPELYGVEPVSYYVKNLILNWNVAFPLACISLPVTMICYLKHNSTDGYVCKWGLPRSLEYWRRYTPVFLIWLTTATWAAIFFLEPHKEERFLYPMYPHLALLAALAFDAISRKINHKWGEMASHVFWSVMITFIILSVCRTFSLIRNYGGSMDIYKSLSEEFEADDMKFDERNDPLRLCIGKEWYRFPSSFFVPPGGRDHNHKGRMRAAEIRLLQSDFRGQLPGQYIYADLLEDQTRHIPTNMNDRNLEETSRYVSLDTCDFVIDRDAPGMESEREPDYSKLTNILEPRKQLPFLVAKRSHPFYRAFYIPFLSEFHTEFSSFTLYRRIPKTVRDSVNP